jgi:hypothetical protein
VLRRLRAEGSIKHFNKHNDTTWNESGYLVYLTGIRRKWFEGLNKVQLDATCMISEFMAIYRADAKTSLSRGIHTRARE